MTGKSGLYPFATLCGKIYIESVKDGYPLSKDQLEIGIKIVTNSIFISTF